MMKSSDTWKVNHLLSQVEILDCKIKTIKLFESNKSSAEIRCKGERLRINEDISKEVFNTILRELNTQKEKTIRDLAKFGVEYVDETA